MSGRLPVISVTGDRIGTVRRVRPGAWVAHYTRPDGRGRTLPAEYRTEEAAAAAVCGIARAEREGLLIPRS